MSTPPFDPEADDSTTTLSDDEVLRKWTVDELDMLHNISGLGPEWRASERRAELKKLEDEDIERVRHIIEGFI